MEHANQYFANWTWDYSGSNENLRGLEIDWSTFKITFPPNADENQIRTIQFLAEPPIPQQGRTAAFRRRWMGKIMRSLRPEIADEGDLCPVAARTDRAAGQSGEEAQQFCPRIRRHAPQRAAGQRTCLRLARERRELFRDGFHLNDDGDKLFTVMLAEEIARLLGPPAPNWQSLPDRPHDK